MKTNTPVKKVWFPLLTTIGVWLLSSNFGASLTAQIEVTQEVSGKKNGAIQIVNANKTEKKTITEWREIFLDIEKRGDMIFQDAPPITFTQSLDEAKLVMKQVEALEKLPEQERQVKKARKKKSKRLIELNEEMKEMLEE